MYPVPFEAKHILQMEAQDHQKWHVESFRETELAELESSNAHTLMHEGSPIACCGAAVFHKGCVRVWALISARATGITFLNMSRWAKRFLDNLKFTRIEATAAADFPQARQWLRAMGFKEEGLMRKYEERGADAYLMALVREDV